MRFPLRSRILVLAVISPLIMAAGTVWHIHHTMVSQVKREATYSLVRASLVLDHMLSERRRGLTEAGAVIARDPRFYAAVALPGGTSDPEVKATLKLVAAEFSSVTRATLFDVLDREGTLLVSARSTSSSREGRKWLIPHIVGGRAATGFLVEPGGQYLVAVTPVVVDRRVVGSLLLGDALGSGLAGELKVLTRSDVTFFRDHEVTGSTLDHPQSSAVLQKVELGRDLPVSPFDVRSGGDILLTLIRGLPGAGSEYRQWVVLQRSLAAETVTLARTQLAVLVLALAVIAIALAFGVMTAKRLTSPLMQLVRGAEEIESGNYDHSIDIRGDDEFGYLAARFNAMRRRERDYVASLEEAARLKSEFVSVASHELRTPITVIQGYHDLFRLGTLGPMTEAQHQALSAMEESLAGLLRIAENAERMAQIEGERLALQREDSDLARIIGEAVSQAVADAPGRRLEIETDVPENLPDYHIDGARIRQVLENLVCNAIRFTPDGGQILVRAWEEGPGFAVEVCDTGIGIPEDKLARLFDRSFSVRESLQHHSSTVLDFNSAGLGLGLGIARGIVEAHDGTIAVRSTARQGTTFTIRIPGWAKPMAA